MLIAPVVMASFIGVGRASVGGNGGSSFLMNGVSPGGLYNAAENMAAFDRMLILAIIAWLLGKAIPLIKDAMENHELAVAGQERIADTTPLSEANDKRWKVKASGKDLSIGARLKYEKTGKMGAWDPQRDRLHEAELEKQAQSKADNEQFQKGRNQHRKKKRNGKGRS